MAENMGMYQVHSNGDAQRRTYKKGGTYLALIVRVLQDSPRKMLTFNELMYELEALVSGERKGLENNIRVCLSSNKCFVKVPVRADKPAKNNYWRVDESRITEKMVRRHFKGPQPAAPLTHRRNVKFSSPFSIESLLKREMTTPRGTFPPLSVSSPPVRPEQQPWRAERAVDTKRWLSWDCPPVETRLVSHAADSYSMYNTTEGDTGHGVIGESSIKRMHVVCAEPSFLIYSRPTMLLI